MSGPWEKFQKNESVTGPWSKFNSANQPIKLTPEGNNVVQPPPNEPSLQEMGPMGVFTATEAINDQLREKGQMLQDIKGPAAVAAYPAGTAAKVASNILPENWNQAALTAVMGGPIGADVMAGAKAVVKPIAKGAGNILADVMGELAGKDPESIKVLFNNPKAMWQKASELFSRKHQESVINAVESDFAKHGAKLGQIEDTLTGNFGTPSYGKAPEVMARPTFDKIRFQLGKEGFRLPEQLSEGIPQPKISKIPQDSPEYKFLIENMVKLKDNIRMSFGDALRMKRNLDKAIDYGLEGANGLQPISADANRILSNMRSSLSKDMGIALKPELRPVWNDINSVYGSAATARAELKKQVLGQNARLTERKLQQLMREGRYDDEVLDRASKIGAQTIKKLEDAQEHLAATQYKKNISGGLMHGTWLPTSPKAVGYGVSAAGGATNAAQALAKSAANYPYIISALAAHAIDRDAKEAAKR